MAAAGGDTVVPTNWKGLIMTAVAVAIVAGLTYVGLNLFLGHAEGEGAAKPETSLQDLYSINARRDIPAMDTVRALPRTALAPTESLPPPEIVDAAPSTADAMDNAGTASSDQAESDEAAPDISDTQPAADAGSADLTLEPSTSASEDDSDALEAAQSDDADPEPDLERSAAPAAATEPTLDTRYRATTAALRAWWSLDEAPAQALGIRFIGPLDSSVAPQGMAVLFDEAVDAQTFASFITMQGPAGQDVQPQWQNGQNPRLVYAKSLPPGRYTLSLEAGLPARNGYLLPQDFSGPVFVN